VQLQEQLQDEMTDELLGMSAQLKRNALGMQGAVEQRGGLLQQADAALDDSHAKAQRSAARAKEQYQRCASLRPEGAGRLLLWRTLLLLLKLLLAGPRALSTGRQHLWGCGVFRSFG
jgi:hypothetical protein